MQSIEVGRSEGFKSCPGNKKPPVGAAMEKVPIVKKNSKWKNNMSNVLGTMVDDINVEW